MIVADSSVWIAYLRNEVSRQTVYFEKAAIAGDIIVGDIIILEVLRGAKSERDALRLEEAMSAFPQETMLDPDLAVLAAQRFRMLRRRGITVRKTADLIIANFCVSRGYALLHQDRDFGFMAEPLGLIFA